jgi:hypothetical protein
MSATRYLKIPNVMTAVNVKSPKSSSNNSKTTGGRGGSKRRRLTMRLNRSPTRYKMTGGAKEYTFDIGFGIQCKLIMHRPHQFGRTDYIYDLKCNDEHVIQNQTVNDIKVKSNIPEYHLSKVIDEINNIIDNNEDESEIVGWTKLRDVLKKKYSEIKDERKHRIRRSTSFTPKRHNTPSLVPKPFPHIPEDKELGGGSKRRRSVRRRKCKRGTTRRL